MQVIMSNTDQKNSTSSPKKVTAEQSPPKQVQRPQLRIIKEGQNPRENKRLPDSEPRRIDDGTKRK